MNWFSHLAISVVGLFFLGLGSYAAWADLRCKIQYSAHDSRSTLGDRPPDAPQAKMNICWLYVVVGTVLLSMECYLPSAFGITQP